MAPRASTIRTRLRRGRGGFTIIELSIVMLIMVVVVAGVTFGLANLRRADLKSVSGQIDAAVRYVYQLSSINGTPYRMVIDMDEGAFWAEEMDLKANACGSFTVKDTRKKKVKVHTGRAGSRKGLFSVSAKGGKKGDDEPSCADEEQDEDGACPAVGFDRVKNNLLKRRALPKGIRFAGVMTTHQQEVQEQGKAYVYFFPNGSVEKAYVFLADDAETYTVETFPLLGKVKVHHEKKDLGDVFREESRG